MRVLELVAGGMVTQSTGNNVVLLVATVFPAALAAAGRHVIGVVLSRLGLPESQFHGRRKHIFFLSLISSDQFLFAVNLHTEVNLALFPVDLQNAYLNLLPTAYDV